MENLNCITRTLSDQLEAPSLVQGYSVWFLFVTVPPNFELIMSVERYDYYNFYLYPLNVFIQSLYLHKEAIYFPRCIKNSNVVRTKVHLYQTISDTGTPCLFSINV